MSVTLPARGAGQIGAQGEVKRAIAYALRLFY